MNNDTRVRFTLRVPEKLMCTLEKEAGEIGVSTNALILKILGQSIEQEDDAEAAED